MSLIPNELRIGPDGGLVMRDGSDAKHYLQQVAASWNIGPDVPVCIIKREDIVRLMNQLRMQYAIAA